MGYDVTFHPISRNELQRFFLDVLDSPDLAEARAAEISDAPDKRFALKRIYQAEDFELDDGDEDDDDDDDDEIASAD